MSTPVFYGIVKNYAKYNKILITNLTNIDLSKTKQPRFSFASMDEISALNDRNFVQTIITTVLSGRKNHGMDMTRFKKKIKLALINQMFRMYMKLEI